jgi:predicted RNA-binding protein with PUA-like domain
MRTWLIKSEPEAYSWDQFVADGKTEWTGVRNHAAKLNLMAMQPGDQCFFYHSNEGLEIVGLARVVRGAAPDSTDATGKWVAVEVTPLRRIATAVTLKDMKAEPALAEMAMIRQSRLSVSPVTEAERAVILRMAGETN